MNMEKVYEVNSEFEISPRKFVERFFFNGVGIGGNDLAIRMGMEGAVNIFPHAAAAEF